MTPLDLEAIRERQAEIAPAFDYEHRDVMFEDVTSAAQMAADARDLLALVDLQTRALLDVEWRSTYAHHQCPSCGAPGPAPYPHLFIGHVRGCPLDAALTAAGLDTQEKRDAARKAGR